MRTGPAKGGDAPARAEADLRPARSRTLASLTFACMVLLWLASAGLFDEATVSLQGDMPRYLMDGVFVHDFVRDHPIAHPLEYTYRYYARYPALSLGHHPPLLPLVEAPFFALLGVSVRTGRIVVLAFAVVAAVAWYGIVRRLFNATVAFAATMLLVTTPFVVDFARVVLSEIPALALLLVAVWAYLRFAETLRTREAVWFGCAMALSVYAKQHTFFVFPILLAHLGLTRGIRALVRGQTIAVYVLVLVLVAPLVPITMEFSRANVAWVTSGTGATRLQANNLLYYARKLWSQLVSAPAMLMAAMGLVAALWRRDARVTLFVLWIVGFYAELTYTGALEARYAIYLIPPFLGLAAATLAAAQGPAARTATGAALALLVGYQAIAANAAAPERADGYERAAEYVVGHPLGDSVLYSANVDSGFFTFYVRKHQATQDVIVLRADKILATSSLSRIIADEIQTRDQLYSILRDFGVGYVVIEDTPYKSPALELLRSEVKTAAFALRERVPLQSRSERLRGIDLAIYEYVDRQPARRDGRLRMRIPLIGGGVDMTFGDLLSEKMH